MPLYYPQKYPLYLLEMMFTMTIIRVYYSLLHVPVLHTGLIYKTFRFSAIKIWNTLAIICHYNTRACAYLETPFITLYDNG